MRRQSEEAIRFAAVFGEAHGLHETDVAALAAIAHATDAGAPLGPAALAAALNLSRPATTALLTLLNVRMPAAMLGCLLTRGGGA